MLRDAVQHRVKTRELRGQVFELVKEPLSGEIQYIRIKPDPRCRWAQLHPGEPDYRHDFLPECLELDPHPSRQ